MAKKNSLATLVAIVGAELAIEKDGSVKLTAEQAQGLNDHLEASAEATKELNDANAALAAKAESASKAASKAGALPVVEYNKKSYQFTAGKFTYRDANGTLSVLKAEEVANNKELIAELIEKNIGTLVEVK